MSRVTVYAWKCDLCNHVWLAMSQHPPSRCAKCKATGWHKSAVTAVQYSDEKVIDDLVTHAIARTSVTLPERSIPTFNPISYGHEFSVTPEILPPAKPSMDHLRDIAAGITTPTFRDSPNLPAAFESLANRRELLQPVPGPPQEREQCDYKEYDEQTGETYACGLAMHPAKVKHTRGRRL